MIYELFPMMAATDPEACNRLPAKGVCMTHFNTGVEITTVVALRHGSLFPSAVVQD